MDALGRLFDIGTGAAPVDLSTAAVTGKRISMKNAGGCTIVVFKGAGTAADDPTFDLQQHTAASAGTTADLDIVTYYYLKQEATLDNDETWSKVTQAAASEVTGNGTSAEEQAIYVFEVDAAQLSDGYNHISLNIADVGTNAQLGAVLYILHDLKVQRKPENLASVL
jgi:hypothetical protein